MSSRETNSRQFAGRPWRQWLRGQPARDRAQRIDALSKELLALADVLEWATKELRTRARAIRAEEGLQWGTAAQEDSAPTTAPRGRGRHNDAG